MTSDCERDLRNLAARLRAATVRVADGNERGAGSGIVLARDLVVTNAHVVRSRQAYVTFPGGRRERATVLSRDDRADLALLGTRGGEAVAELRWSKTLLPGELVVAFGNPHGIDGALATGLVERCNSRWVVANVRLAPGNSGGPLADAAGRVVGINSMIANGRALAVPTEMLGRFYEGALRAA